MTSNSESDLTLRYWRAVATLPADRKLALSELTSCFREGTAPDGLDGPKRGRLLATTLGVGKDLLAEGMARLWMPWRGKTFGAGEGRNLFDAAVRYPCRLLFPKYTDFQTAGPGAVSAFAFRTRVAASALEPDTKVFDIDYDHEGSPDFLVRDVLDELVAIDDGLYLGQALLRWKGEYRRAAWFQLQE